MEDDGTSTPFRPPAFVAAMAATNAGTGTSSSSAAAALSLPSSSFAPMTESPTGASTPLPPLPVPSGICVFSGGTAANSLVDAFQEVVTDLSSNSTERQNGGSNSRPKSKKPCPLTYIIPISDNGGSSSELIRFFGGPSVGDIRSRLVRLIPTSEEEDSDDDDDSQEPRGQHTTNERAALRALFEHRLCSSDPHQARAEWLDIVEARHLLWTFIPSPTRELIRAVLNTLNLEIVKRARPTSVFNFAAASVGNLFLTGARLFSGSFEAAIYLLSLLCGIPEHVVVLPAINSNFTHHISAGLADGTTIAGQVNISHPSAPTSLPDGGRGGGDREVPVPWPDVQAADPVEAAESSQSTRTSSRQRAATAVDFEDATLPGSLPALRRPQIAFSKDDEEDLPARISRVWYINPYGHEIRPPANSKVVASLQQARAIIYSIGSLYTSIIPSLVLRGVGGAISEDVDRSDGKQLGDSQQKKRCGRPKILILNSKLDRETGPSRDPMTAVDFVRAITAACKQSQSDTGAVEDGECARYVTHVVYLEAVSTPRSSGSSLSGSESSSTNSPKVDVAELGRLGIRCVPVASQRPRSNGRGRHPAAAAAAAAAATRKAMERYDGKALTRALEGIVDGTLG